jgi:hypothetical protein
MSDPMRAAQFAAQFAPLLRGLNFSAFPPSPTVRLPDGTVGYCVRAPRTDDCWAAAVATVLQVPIQDVPDAQLDHRLRAGEKPETIDRDARAKMSQWLQGRGIRMVEHAQVPVAIPRWIGVVPLRGWFNDHCLVMSESNVLFDPTVDVSVAFGGARVRLFRAQDVASGFSFSPLNEALQNRKVT